MKNLFYEYLTSMWVKCNIIWHRSELKDYLGFQLPVINLVSLIWQQILFCIYVVFFHCIAFFKFIDCWSQWICDKRTNIARDRTHYFFYGKAWFTDCSFCFALGSLGIIFSSTWREWTDIKSLVT